MGWNGADLVSDFSAELGDTTTTFQTKVLRWINDGIREISTSHEWPFLREKGKVIFSASENTKSIALSQPSAPSLAALAGGTLTTDVAYKVLVTFYESIADIESIAGVESASITPTGTNLSITVSSIPVSSSTLVTARRVYISKSGGAFYLYSTISDNTTTSTTVTTDTSSTQEPPDENLIYKIDGDFYIDGNRSLQGSTVQRILYETNGVSSSGQPMTWAPVNHEEILVYPTPSATTTLSFYYFKYPAKVFNVSTSKPQMPSYLFDTLHNYVIWRGYQYRDRAGKESMKLNYDEGLRLAISRKGASKKGSGRVRCVTPDSDGYAV